MSADELLQEVRRRALTLETRTDKPNVDAGSLPSPATKDQIGETETRLGFELPEFLRNVYCEVANGGFGPSHGISGVIGGFSPSHERHVVDIYKCMSMVPTDDPEWEWPSLKLPFCDWGCNIYSCVDCSDSCGAVYTFDEREREPVFSNAFALTHLSIAAWFADWTSGADLWDNMYELHPRATRTIRNPFTGEGLSVPRYRLRRLHA